MPKVKILTDSAADLPQDIVLSRSIRVIPLYVTLADTTMRDGVELSADSLYKQMKEDKAVPRTSQPSPEDFYTAFSEELRNYDEVLCLTISSNLSGTHSSARLACELLGADARRVFINDSLNASLGEGLKVLVAADLADKGKSAVEIINALEQLKLRTTFTVDHLKYLERGGRIGKASAAVATVLDIKPILTMSAEGRIESETKVRGRQKSIRHLTELVEQDLSADYSGYLCLSHAYCPEECMKLAQALSVKYPLAKVVTSQIGAVIGSHVGPGCLALFYQLP